MNDLGSMTPSWVDFVIMAGALLLVAIGCLIWLVFLRKPGRRHKPNHHRHQRQRHQRQPLPTTPAHTGGQPPARPEQLPPHSPPSAHQP
jgi:hypothetical protein